MPRPERSTGYRRDGATRLDLLAGRSRMWAGGMAFHESRSNGQVAARAYLITVAQFSDVAHRGDEQRTVRRLHSLVSVRIDTTGSRMVSPNAA
jgi:hypothetical protein